MVAPTLIDLKRLNLLDGNGRFCGTGANYDLIKGELAQFRLSHNTANPAAQANRVVGVIDPAIALGPPSPCFEGMAVVNSQEAWAIAKTGQAGQLIGLELAHTLGLTPPNRESPFDGAHSQNVAAENPPLNRRFNVVQRSFIPTDRSLLKPSGTSPSPDNVNTLLEAPDYSFLLCVFGGTPTSECQTYGPGTVSASAPVAATLSFVMSGSTTGEAGISSSATGAAAGTSVVESYFASTVPQTAPLASSEYRLVQRTTAGTILSNLGVPVTFQHSEHGTGSGSTQHQSGLFSFVLPFESTANRIELWKGAPGASGSLLLYAQDRTAPPQVTGLSVGAAPIGLRASGRSSRKNSQAAILATYSVTNTNDSGAGSLRQAILDANTNAGADTITFAIGTGPQTISPLHRRCRRSPIRSPSTERPSQASAGRRSSSWGGQPRTRDQRPDDHSREQHGARPRDQPLRADGERGNGWNPSQRQRRKRDPGQLHRDEREDWGRREPLRASGWGRVTTPSGWTTADARNIVSGNQGPNGAESTIVAAGNTVRGQLHRHQRHRSADHAVANNVGVIVVATCNTIGGTTASARNVVSGNNIGRV